MSPSACRRYRCDEKGEIVETDDHLMRATGLMLVHALAIADSENRAVLAAAEEAGWESQSAPPQAP